MLNAITELEFRIINDPEFIEGLEWGEPRRGHPEGKVIYHIREVLNNIEEYFVSCLSPARVRKVKFITDLRLIALIHDTFKYQVDRSKPKVGDNHHGYLAMKFAEKYISDESVLTIIKVHDDAFKAWLKGSRYNEWKGANNRISDLLETLKKTDSLLLFNAFFFVDNSTGDKVKDSYEWFQTFLDD